MRPRLSPGRFVSDNIRIVNLLFFTVESVLVNIHNELSADLPKSCVPSSFLSSYQYPECLHLGYQILCDLCTGHLSHFLANCPLVTTEDHHQGFTGVLSEEPDNVLADDDQSDTPEAMCDPVLPACCLLHPHVKDPHAHRQLVIDRAGLAECVVSNVPEKVAQGVGTRVVAARLH